MSTFNVFKIVSLRYAMQMLSNISPQKYFIAFHPLLTINDKIKSILVLNLKAFCQSINSAHANEQVAASSSCLLIHLGLISPKSFLGRQTNRFSGDKQQVCQVTLCIIFLWTQMPKGALIGREELITTITIWREFNILHKYLLD